MEHRPLGSLLNESQESTSQKEAIRYIEQKKGWSHEEADNFVRVELRHDIPSLRDKKIAKFTLGVTRMFFDGEINNERIINDLNKTLKLLSAHLNEYDRNLNGLSAQELINRFKQVRLDNANAERAEIDSMNFSGNSNYTIVPINSFEEAEKYYEYTNPDSRWCLTYIDEMFDDYTKDGINQIYFCLQNGFENVPRQVGDKAPLDEYGLSMLSIIVNEDGGLAYCTTRWNHKNGGSDSAMSAKEVSQVVGVNFYNTFKPNNKWANIIETVKQRLANGESPEDLFDYVDDFEDGFALVECCGKCNFINQEGQLISNKWYDEAHSFSEGFAAVKYDEKWNFINQKGQPISNKWYDGVYSFSEGFAAVKYDGKCNLINQEGQPISNKWYDSIESFSEGSAAVKYDGKWNFINQEGQPISNKWYDAAYGFNDGFAKVEYDGKCNLINQEGQPISNKWYDSIVYFSEGFAAVKYDGKWNYINQEGQSISNRWFDEAYSFRNGFAKVGYDGNFYYLDTSGRLHNNINENKEYKISKNMLKNKNMKKKLIRLTEGDLHRIIKESVNKVIKESNFTKVELNDKCNLVNQKGQLISKQWFDDIYEFYEGLAKVVVNDKCNFITQEGNFISNQWFDDVYEFYEGLAKVELKGKYNFINQEGKLISNQWFDYGDSFYDGFATVALNGKYYNLDTNGRLHNINGNKEY